MKRLIVTLSLFLIVVLGYSQVTNVADFRVANATTAFGVNIPVGTKVYDIANNKYYVATAGVASTATLTTASGSFSLLNDAGTDDQQISDLSLSGTTLQLTLEGDTNGQQTVDLSSLQDGTGTDDQTASEVNITDAGEYYTGTTVETALQEAGANIASNTSDIATNTAAIAAISDTDDQTAAEVNITDAGEYYTGSTVEAALQEAGADIASNTSDIATNAAAIAAISDTDDQTASEVSISDAGGIITATDVEGALQENRTAINLNTAKVSNVSTSLSTGTVTGTSYGITSDGGSDDVVLAAATTSAAGIMTAAQVTTLGKLDAYTWATETYSEDDATPTAHALTYVAITGGCTVSINGSLLSEDDYTLTTSTLTLSVPVLQYDQVVVTYRTTGTAN